jgi:hypothetical protein
MNKHGAVLVETGEYLNMSHPPTYVDSSLSTVQYKY